MLKRMAVEPSSTIRGSKEDGDAQIDTHFQPSHIKDDITMDIATTNKIMDMLQEIDEQQQSLEENLKDLSKQLEAEHETLKKNLLELGREMDATSLMQRSQSEELRHKQWKVIAERTPLESGYNIPGDFAMVAVYVEQAICAYVLPEVFSVNDVSANILYDLFEW